MTIFGFFLDEFLAYNDSFHHSYANTDGWMQIPVTIPNCPPGLEYLTMLDQLLIKQKVNLTQVLIGFEQNNKFAVKNCLGQVVSGENHHLILIDILNCCCCLNFQVYMAVEDTDCCTRNCFGPIRPFDMKVLDAYQNEVIHLYRPLACSSCCFPCCLQSIEVSSPPGHVVGRIEQEWTCWYPNFRIKNHADETVLRIEGPCCTLSCGNDVNFKVKIDRIARIETFKLIVCL